MIFGAHAQRRGPQPMQNRPRTFGTRAFLTTGHTTQAQTESESLQAKATLPLKQKGKPMQKEKPMQKAIPMQKGAKRARPAEAMATRGKRLAADVCCENFGLASGFARQPIDSCAATAMQSPTVRDVRKLEQCKNHLFCYISG